MEQGRVSSYIYIFPPRIHTLKIIRVIRGKFSYYKFNIYKVKNHLNPLNLWQTFFIPDRKTYIVLIAIIFSSKVSLKSDLLLILVL